MPRSVYAVKSEGFLPAALRSKALPGRGKRGGARTLIAYRSGQAVFFIYGFPKNERANIEHDELKALRLLARELLGYGAQELAQAVEAGELIEVSDNG
jgi:hypothetical protein